MASKASPVATPGAPGQLRWQLAASFVVSMMVLPVLGALTLTGDWWAGLDFKGPNDTPHWLRGTLPDYKTADTSVPNEYEACEYVRFHSFVRAPLNSWSSYAFLWPPAIFIAHSRLSSAALRAAAGSTDFDLFIFHVFGELNIIFAATFISHASFVYHASTTHQMNWIDVRGMNIAMGANVLAESYLLASLIFQRRFGVKARLRLLRKWGMLVFVTCTLVWHTLALTTDVLSHAFAWLMPSLFIASLVLSLMHSVVTPRHCRRRRFASLIMCVACCCKELDSLKLVCYSSWRHGPFQLTAIYHVLLGLVFGISSGCSIELVNTLHFDDAAAVCATEGGPQK